MAVKIRLLGRDDDLLLAIGAAVVGVGAVAFLTTAITAEAQRRWAQATAGVSTGMGFVLGLPTGRKKNREKGFEEGYWTPNPAIPGEAREAARELSRAARGGGSAVASTIGSAAMSGVAVGASTVVARHIADRFSPGPSSETLPPAPPASEKDKGPSKRELLQAMTVAQLRKLAREMDKGGNGLAQERKEEIIERLMED